ncbi:MAG: hypothetical protein ACK5LY_07300 [Lachnospirales bacterium]
MMLDSLGNYGIKNSYSKTAKFNITEKNVKNKAKETEKKVEDDTSKTENEAVSVEFNTKTYEVDEQDKIDMKIQELGEKLRGGSELTDSELEFLKEYSPAMYAFAKEIESVREAFLKKMLKCDSKEEVNALKLSSDIEYLKKIEKAEEQGDKGEVLKQITLRNQVENEYYQFTSTERYKKLPDEDEDDII